MKTADPLLLLRAEDPARDLEPTAAEAARIDAALERLLAEPVKPRRPRRRLVVGVAAVAAAATAAVAALPGGTPAPSPETASAATVLRQLGARAGAAPAETGRYAYMRQVQYVSHMFPDPDGDGSFVAVLPHDEEQWIAADGTGVVRTRIRRDEPSFPTAADRAAYERLRPPPGGYVVLRTDGMRLAGFTPAEVRALPTDPARLRARLAAAPITAPDRLTAAAGTLLGASLTPPAVRRALFELLRTLPGATVVPDAADPRGRHGVGIAFESEAWRTLFVFDPGTGALLATRSIGERELPGREIEDWSLVLETGARDSAPAATATARSTPR
jgi:hypothetical protein